MKVINLDLYLNNIQKLTQNGHRPQYSGGTIKILEEMEEKNFGLVKDFLHRIYKA